MSAPRFYYASIMLATTFRLPCFKITIICHAAISKMATTSAFNYALQGKWKALTSH